MQAGTAVAVRMEGICKSFGSVRALDSVNMDISLGEIRALVGENGAGKTTLMTILYGMYRPDAGRMIVWGRETGRDWSPRQAMTARIGMIHQHFSLIPNHSVLENVLMPQLRWTHVRPRWHHHRAVLERLCQEYGFSFPLEARVESLSVGQQQQVEILKLLYQGASLLILDEPTAVLTPQQTDRLLDLLLRLRDQGHSVVLITHKLSEAFAVADSITVLRRGRHVATVARRDTNPREIAFMMVEREWSPASGWELRAPEPGSLLEVRDLVVGEEHRRPAVDRVSLVVRPGEIVGVAGVAGNGQTELAEALVGIRRCRAGRILIAGRDATSWTIAQRLRAGLRFIPEDRHLHGMVGELSLAENLVIDRCDLPPFSVRGVLRHRAVRQAAAEAVQHYGIRAPSPETPMVNLSGGNQQRAVLARALAGSPRVIVACQPTRGLDFAATEYVRAQLVRCAARGVGVLVVSSELEELMQLCHRILVIYRGQVIGELSRHEFDAGTIGLLMTGQVPDGGRYHGQGTRDLGQPA
ncbi:MAG: ABC transporter ATP-binding protein [Firmicutes bacterium]|nr:ABC transporter ATP-binding protein [Bacillota bacterium]